MSEKEWDLKDFESPKSKDILPKSKKKKGGHRTKKGQISLYVGEENKKRIEVMARQRGMSASAFVFSKLIQYDIL